MITLDEVLGALVRLDCNPRQTGPNQWQARCPAHDDRSPSLAISGGRDDGPLLHCHAGCTFLDVLSALGPTEGSRPMTTQPPPTPEPVPRGTDLLRWQDALTPEVGAAVQAVKGWSYPTLRAFHIGYHDKRLVIPAYERNLLVQVYRYSPAGGTPKTIALRHRQRPLFHLPELRHVPDAPLWIVEGEGDTLSSYELALWGIGVPGVNAWKYDYAERFAGRHVRICMDCDRQGREAAYRIFMDLAGVASDVKVIDLAPEREDGFDLTDFLLDARKRGDLEGARRVVRWMTEH